MLISIIAINYEPPELWEPKLTNMMKEPTDELQAPDQKRKERVDGKFVLRIPCICCGVGITLEYKREDAMPGAYDVLCSPGKKCGGSTAAREVAGGDG